MKIVHSEVCGLSSITWALFLQRDVAAAFLKVYLFRCVAAEISEVAPISKPEQIKPELHARLQTNKENVKISFAIWVN